MDTAVWLSDAVEKTWLFLVGMVVFRSMSLVVTPPSVSMPRDSGVTSSSSTSLTWPVSTAPWMAAPIATTSSGFTPRCGSFLKNSFTVEITFGMRVMPPTRTASLIWSVVLPASVSAFLHGSMLFDQIVHELLELGPRQLDRADAWGRWHRP